MTYDLDPNVCQGVELPEELVELRLKDLTDDESIIRELMLLVEILYGNDLFRNAIIEREEYVQSYIKKFDDIPVDGDVHVNPASRFLIDYFELKPSGPPKTVFSVRRIVIEMCQTGVEDPLQALKNFIARRPDLLASFGITGVSNEWGQ